MVIRSRLPVVATLAILAACRPSAPVASIDPALSERLPASAIAISGIDLDRLRASPLFARLPPVAQAFLAPFTQAHRVLIAYTGAELLTIARGTVPGATQIAPDLALSGAPDLIAAVTRPHATPAILAPATAVAAQSPVWFAVRGGIALPLEGNFANLNNLLRPAEFITLAVQPGDPAAIELLAQSPTPQTALAFEQSFRAIASLAIATGSRRPDTVALLQSIHIVRENRVVRVSISAALDPLASLLF